MTPFHQNSTTPVVRDILISRHCFFTFSFYPVPLTVRLRLRSACPHRGYKTQHICAVLPLPPPHPPRSNVKATSLIRRGDAPAAAAPAALKPEEGDSEATSKPGRDEAYSWKTCDWNSCGPNAESVFHCECSKKDKDGNVVVSVRKMSQGR